MALVEVKVPDIGDFKDVEIIELLVKPGDTVKAEQSLLTVESDKASMEIPSSHAGVVKEMKVKLGDKVSEGTLVLLLEMQRVEALVAVVIIGREIAISALREWMAGMGARRSVAVHSLGKLKTISQLVAIPMLLYHQPLFGFVPVQRIGTWLIYAAALLTLWSMFYYLRQAWPLLRDSA